jgi:predicted protein tyrosine phosphatase
MTQPFILNVAMSDVQKGTHRSAGDSGVLIQIVDPDMDHPKSRQPFSQTSKYKFLDIEKGDEGVELYGISQEDANSIVKVLQKALTEQRNVIVHCVAGVCRSGAVVEVGVMMGFQDTGAYRQPNLLVKQSMMRSLGWTYEENKHVEVD